jgi:hypothetical protein
VALNQQVYINFSMERGTRIMNLYFVHKRIILAVKRVESISDRMSHNTKRL